MADNIKDLINYPDKINVFVESVSIAIRNIYEADSPQDAVIKFIPMIDSYEFIQTEELTELGVAVHPYGAIIIPDYESLSEEEVTIKIMYKGTEYTATESLENFSNLGSYEFSKSGDDSTPINFKLYSSVDEPLTYKPIIATIDGGPVFGDEQTVNFSVAGTDSVINLKAIESGDDSFCGLMFDSSKISLTDDSVDYVNVINDPDSDRSLVQIDLSAYNSETISLTWDNLG